MLVCRVVVEENISVLLTNNFIDAVLTCNIASVKTFMSNCMQGYSLRFKINLVRHVHLGLRFGGFLATSKRTHFQRRIHFGITVFQWKAFQLGLSRQEKTLTNLISNHNSRWDHLVVAKQLHLVILAIYWQWTLIMSGSIIQWLIHLPSKPDIPGLSLRGNTSLGCVRKDIWCTDLRKQVCGATCCDPLWIRD